MELKRNHFIPRFMIDYWVDAETRHRAVHVHEIAKRRSYPSTGMRPKPFSFAISSDLYVHSASGDRAVGLERWFSGLENTLASLVSQAHQRAEPITYGTSKHPTLALMALLGLECRSRYNLNKIQATLDSDEGLRNLLDPDSGAPAEQQVLENIVHQVSDRVATFTPTEMVFMIAPGTSSWLLCDRPYFSDDGLEYRFIVLTNKVMLAYQRSSDVAKYKYVDATPEFFETMNERIAMQARDWLVAASAEQLERYQKTFDSEEWRANVAADKVVYAPIRNVTTGWRISS
jgi:hypothetical protein